MRSSHNPHAHFFSSIKQVEKRLKLENTSHQSINPANNCKSTESLSSPLYLQFDNPTTNPSILQESEPPQEFLSKSLDFQETQKDPQQSSPEKTPERINLLETYGVDDIETLMELLGLSDCEQQNVGSDLNSNCDDGFFANVLKVKGPKCKKEVQRLEGWIKHFMNEGQKKEPFRLAHLLLAKAALVSDNSVSDNSDGVEGFEFPSTVDEFLKNDPPEN